MNKSKFKFSNDLSVETIALVDKCYRNQVKVFCVQNGQYQVKIHPHKQAQQATLNGWKQDFANANSCNKLVYYMKDHISSKNRNEE